MNELSNPFSLENKRIVITGASSGIGRHCSIVCSRMGARLILFGRDQARLSETLQGMVNPENHVVNAIDLLAYTDITNKVNEIVHNIGRIDGLVNCAGISTTLPVNAVSPEKMIFFFQTNVIGPINLTRQIVRSANFSEKGGSVIFISSIMSVAGESGKTLYSMTKGALVSAAKSMAIELSKRKIRVNCISPGVVVTPMSQNAVYSKDVESLNRIKDLHPLGLGKPEDVANACVFLLSDASGWITGTNLIVDGGYFAR
ncbi:MAG: SDR family oxidoreductase [Bacteroidales bacterium]|jgi:NAD(P)-dependent dehydrogenase (short-subunit alcohol dehydrogenase family)|nr:SDR family oxidoreductase [Bacteroidales bacterium]HQB27689.1 SDR family oxidoreductase [Paludibacter sp.]